MALALGDAHHDIYCRIHRGGAWTNQTTLRSFWKDPPGTTHFRRVLRANSWIDEPTTDQHDVVSDRFLASTPIDGLNRNLLRA